MYLTFSVSDKFLVLCPTHSTCFAHFFCIWSS